MGVDLGGGKGKGGGGSRYQRQQKRGAGGGKGKSYTEGSQSARLNSGGRKESAWKTQRREEGDQLDKRFGYERYSEGPPRLGWIFNMLPTSIPDASGNERSGLDMYFLEQDGGTFKATMFYKPYFYVAVRDDRFLQDLAVTIRRRFEDSGMEVSLVNKEDLDMPNHLSGKLRRFLKLSFQSVSDLMEVRSKLLPIIKANQARAQVQDAYMHLPDADTAPDDLLETLVDIREYDVPYYVRCSIDADIRVGAWYIVTPEEQGVRVEWQKEMVDKAEPKVLAYDIECTKAPLKFPNVEIDQVFMISYMVDGQGYLIISREVVSQDIEDFEYTPKPAFSGPFHIFNEANEEALLRRFFSHVQEIRPQIIVTYNGDFFDWPFVDARAKVYDIDMEKEIGVGLQGTSEYRGRCCAHMDAIYWVKRDSYLPQGAHGLKAVTKYKLGYDPVEVDPEDMVRYAADRPAEMANYSVSDAVATYYLYQVYVHLFVFSLCTIIPMGPDDVLRKGSGTLCEALLMVEAFKGNVVCPNKHSEPLTRFHEGHLLETETYIGGHVECLETGVFRSDLPERFRLVPSALQGLIDNIDRDLTFAIEVENGVQRGDVTNYDQVRTNIVEQLEMLRDCPLREEEPYIYHLDVAAMYPNIILSNRLQPGAIVDQTTCASCDFNQDSNACKRPLPWVWRGDMTPASRMEYQSVKTQLSYETVDGRPFMELSDQDQAARVKARLKDYTQKVYKKTKVTKEEQRVDTVCMRENSFYVNTVRAFRDRRYDYKILTKKWKKQRAKAETAGDVVTMKEAEDKAQVYDSLQLAHKCILNSFYGYVMRKGARWRSMEMAGIVTYTGAMLITQARELVEQIGRPLELDTDGIWCILPSSFPEDFTFSIADGGKIGISYPCVMLNADVHERYTNHQYQELVDPAARKYTSRSECSIFFEVDGPYRCMVLPSSTEEGRLLKKRYAVFNFDGSLAELKGFELKRRGELELIKGFQSQVFQMFLRGSSLTECYDAVAEIANHYLDILDSKGKDLADDELMEQISQNKTMSQTLEDYGTQKGTSQTTARRLADFLGMEMIKDKGLNCRMIISSKPTGAPVTDRAIPTAIFSADPGVKKHYLRKWLKDPAMEDFDVRNILDWEYYKERLGKTVQKIITIPAAMQKVANPVPRVKHPEWLGKVVREKNDGYRQTRIDQLFAAAGPTSKEGQAQDKLANAGSANAPDIEDMGASGKPPRTLAIRARVTKLGARADHAPPWSSTHALDKEDMDVDDGEQTQQEGGEAPGAGGAAEGGVVVDSSPPPRREDDFAEWLQHQKEQWRAHRLARRSKRQMDKRDQALDVLNGNASGGFGSGTGGGGSGSGSAVDKRRRMGQMGGMGVQGYLRSAQDALLHSFWQVVEVRQGDHPGSFTVFAMTGPKDLQIIPITVPRTFYVNSREAGESTKWGRRVSRFLPNGRRALHLYEINIDEDKFQRNEKQVASFLHHPNVEGVYELATPLLYRACLEMGCLARVARDRRVALRGVKAGAGQAAGFELQDLELVNLGAHHYLHPSVASFRRVYLYHSRAGHRGVLGLFFVQGTNEDIEPELTGEEEQVRPVKSKAVVWLVNPFSGREGEQRPPLPRIFDHFNSVPGSSCSFKVQSAATMDEAWAAADASLAAYSRQRNGPTLLLSQGPVQGSDLRKSLPALAEYPVVHIPGNAEDGRYPALGWQMFAAQRMVQRFLLTPDWLADRLLCSRFSHLPLANVGADAPCAMADAFFGRLLTHNRHILWASEGSRPDLGGTEGDDNDVWAEELSSPTVLQPGAYRSICIELQIFGLSVNSVLASTQLENMEGSHGVTSLGVNHQGGGGEGSGGGESGDGDAGMFLGGGGREAAGAGAGDAASAFRILKVLVSNWLEEVSHTGNPHADSLLQHFYRWICARQSLLYNSALHLIIHRLMHKVFMRLVGELRRLGATVVFADFQRVIIATNKSDLAAAKDYADFVVSTLTSRDLFNCLQVHPKAYWEQLLFLDAENYGGIKVNQEQGEEADDAGVSNGDGPAAKDAEGSEGEEEGDHEADRDDDEEEEEEEEDEDGQPMRRRRRKELQTGQQVSEIMAQRRRVTDPDSDEDEEPDAENGGQAAGPEAGAGDSGAGAQFEKGKGSLIAHWNLAEYLPPSVKQLFQVMVSMFIYRPHAKAQELRQRRNEMVASLSTQLALTQGQGLSQAPPSQEGEAAAGGPASPGEALTQAQSAGGTALAVQEALRREEESETATMAYFLRDLVSKTLTKKVLVAVPEIKKYSGNGPEAFPALAGASRELTNPALEFVKSLCHVLDLDQTVAHEVETLRKQALAEMGVRQFSQEGQFVDPCLSFVLPDVICSFCNLCLDLDLCRDPGLMAEDEDERWRCSNCFNHLDKGAIELSLVEHVYRRSTRYQLQDLRCSKCGTVASSSMGLTCKCSAPLVGDEPAEDFHKAMKLLRQVARWHSMEFLQETVETFLVIDRQLQLTDA